MEALAVEIVEMMLQIFAALAGVLSAPLVALGAGGVLIALYLKLAGGSGSPDRVRAGTSGPRSGKSEERPE